MSCDHRCAVALCCVLWGPLCLATGLLDLYDETLLTHPVIKQSQEEMAQAEAQKDVVRSHLLPQLSATGNVSWNALTQEQTNPRTHVTSSPTADYQTLRGSVQARQALFDVPNLLRLQGSQETIEQSRAQFEATRISIASDLIDRYFEALTACDRLKYVESEKKATTGELDRLHAMRQRQLVPVTDVLEMEAYYEGLLTREIEAAHAYAMALEKLHQISGVRVTELAALGHKKLPPVEGDIDEWVKGAMDSHPSLRAADRGVAAARKARLAARAEHLPQVSLHMSETHAENGGFDNRQEAPYTIGTVGVQVTVPLFEGGGTAAATRVAAAQYATALDKREQTLREVELRMRSAYLDAESAWAKMQSTRLEQSARGKARQAQQKSYELHLATVSALLDAKKNHVKARIKHSKARYRYVVARLALSVWDGTLGRADIEDVDRLLVEPRKSPAKL